MIRQWRLRVVALVCRRVQDFPGRWRLVRWGLSEVRRIGAFMGVRRVRTTHGFQIDCDLRDWIGQYVFVTGSYEEPTVNLLPALVGPGDLVVDVGANIGFYTLRLAQLVGPRGTVVSFEPMPHALSRLKAHLGVNGMNHVTVVEAAASDGEGVAELFLGPPEHTSIASINPRDGAASVRVRCQTLDSGIGSVNRVALLKIDAEGVEGRVLAGANRLLSECSPAIVAEVNDWTWSAALLADGYRMFHIDWDGIREVRAATGAALPSQFNALFLKGEVPEALRSRLREGG